VETRGHFFCEENRLNSSYTKWMSTTHHLKVVGFRNIVKFMKSIRNLHRTDNKVLPVSSQKVASNCNIKRAGIFARINQILKEVFL
jgi:hypothetical protein